MPLDEAISQSAAWGLIKNSGREHGIRLVGFQFPLLACLLSWRLEDAEGGLSPNKLPSRMPPMEVEARVGCEIQI